MTGYDELIEQLQDRLSYFERRMAMAGRDIQIEPIVDPWEGVWAFLNVDEEDCSVRLRIHPSLPEELIDWVVVHALAQLMVHPLYYAALTAVDALTPGKSGARDDKPPKSAREWATWSGRIDKAEERLVQRICDVILRREHTFLVDAWFAMLSYDD